MCGTKAEQSSFVAEKIDPGVITALGDPAFRISEVQDDWQQQSHHPALNSQVPLGSSSLAKFAPFPSVAKHRMVLPKATPLGRPHWEQAHRLSSGLSKSHLAGSDHHFDKTAVETAPTTKIH